MLRVVMMDQRIAELEKKFEGVERQISDVKDEFNDTINHVERVLQNDVDFTWDFIFYLFY